MVDILIGLVIAVAVAGATMWLSGLLRPRMGGGLTSAIATGVGVVLGGALWFGLSRVAPGAPQIAQGIGIGLGVGISKGLQRPDAQKKG